MALVVLGQTSRSDLGTPIGLGCQGCGLFDICGGITDFDCYADCCGEPENCRIACPKATRWVDVVHDAGGLGMNGRYAISQREDDLPPYIPHIYHGSGRSAPLACGYVALTTFDVTVPRGQRRFSAPSDLRRYFRIADEAKILLLSVGKDNRLELHWKHSAARELAQYLATLGISHITAPNFSYAINDPRAEHLANRSRSLTEAERFTAAGLSVVPHVNAFTQKDWDGWRDFFRNHPQLRMVSQEFQTGLSNRDRAAWHIQQLLNIEEKLGRGFRLIAVGGRQHLPLLVKLSAVTVTDSNPFVKTQHRQKLLDGVWVKRATAKGELLDRLMNENLAGYMKQVEAEMLLARLGGPETVARVPVSPLNEKQHASAAQLPLWPVSATAKAASA